MSKKSKALKELTQLLEIKEKLYKALTKGIRNIGDKENVINRRIEKIK